MSSKAQVLPMNIEADTRVTTMGQGLEIVEAPARAIMSKKQHLEARCKDLAPVQRLPHDVLREIFIGSLPAEVTFDCLEPPLLLTQICRDWRALAWDYSLLWTSLKITTKQSDPQIALREELLAAWFQRCKGSSVDFQFIFRKATRPKEHKTPGLARLYNRHFKHFPKLLAHVPAYNFRSLTLHHLPLQVVRSFPRNALPSLERLVLTFHYLDRFTWDGNDAIKAFENCPLLRRVALKGGCLRDLNKALSISWCQLTHFFLNGEPSPAVFWECFMRMVDLDHAFLCLDGSTLGGSPIAYSEQSKRTVVLPKLVGLTLDFSNEREPSINLPDFWRYFDFPNLQTLRLSGQEADFSTWSGPASSKSIMVDKLRSMKHITRLSLCMFKLEHADCAYIFGLFPQVNHLDLDMADYEYYDGALAALQMDEGHLPQLKTVVFEVGSKVAQETIQYVSRPNDDIIDAVALRSMALSRRTCEPEKRLERIVFYGSEAWQVSEFKSFNKVLEEFVESGLVVENKVNEMARKDRMDGYWLERDDYLDDWREAGEIFNYHTDK
ncbi:hypothetical protein BKA70DRAFT_1345450 [Coprinopsis sp. MPI-PUGE-AT-0042]|nr:hypothetical protein BKA70DRAFT_1345450 [Coprinopsis sp. MPI-PUGE-AT-0042]